MPSAAISRDFDATENRNIREKVYASLHRDGIFSSSFLGPDDTMASSKYDPDDFWPEVAVYREDEVKKLFAKYKMLRFNEHRTSGTAPGGDLHDWHIYSVVAKKT
jgi:hypothetical protein